ncbi:MAG TPA: recombinase family protein [Candidatus Onthocola stercoravium]|nr:recombinase family protein [Candidatus Onthocola stercoravium]
MNDTNEVYGIARCSTSKQDVEYEINELVKKGVPKENIFIEYISGKADLNKRTELDKLFKIVKPGISKIIATDITRIARNPKTFYEILEFIENNKLCLEIGSLVCDCRNDELDIMTSTMLQVLSVFASFDLKMKKFQIKLGLKNAVDKGVKLGRKPVTKKTLENDPMFMKYYAQYKAKQINLCEMARLWGKCRNTCYNSIKIYESKD